jgi:hypothetical protein
LINKWVYFYLNNHKNYSYAIAIFDGILPAAATSACGIIAHIRHGERIGDVLDQGCQVTAGRQRTLRCALP